MNTQSSIERIAAALGVPVANFFKNSDEQKKYELRERVAKLMGSYATLEDTELSDTDLLRYIADRILQDLGTIEKPTYKKGPAIQDQTYSHEDGKGRIINIIGNTVQIYFGSNVEAAAKEVGILELFWNADFNRWDYGDRTKK